MTEGTDESVLLKRVDGVAIVSLNNPSRKNAFTPESADRFVEVLDAVDNDPGVGALVIQGQGGSFCSGADLSSLGSAMEDPAGEQSYQALERIYRAFTRTGELGVPTVAAVRGSAVGAGVNLMMAADVRVVSVSARIISGFARLNLHPGGGHLQLLAQASGFEAATVMAVLNQEVDGRRAVQIGLAWEAVPDDEVEPHALSLARTAGADPDLSRKMIQSLRLTNPPPVPWAVALQAERAPQLWSLRRAAVRRGGEK